MRRHSHRRHHHRHRDETTRGACPACGAGCASGQAFCGACGARLPAPTEADAVPAPLPVSFVDGRYLVQRLLGEGARKRVYLAHDARLDRDVAIGVLKTQELDAAGVERARQEAQAMAQLGDHPNIVTVYDIAEDDGRLYLVSQYMVGGDLEHLLDDTPDHRLPIDQAVQIAEDVCHALEHAHAHGVIHRDLKPANVWLGHDGIAKLGDFGLAMAADRVRLTQHGAMVGTAAYMAPEQAMGRPADARSDLYALGAVLYEMVAGRPPFLGDDVVAVISQHLNTAPVAPSWHNPGVPAALDALIMHLLAKTPDERLPSATAVHEALATIAASLSTAPAASPVPVSNPLDRLAGGVFVGRDQAMQELRDALDTAFAGHGRLVMLVGEPGIGKTRTADELATYARLRRAQVLVGRCYEGEGAPAYWPWLQVIRAYVHDREPVELRAEMGSGVAEIAQIVNEVRERLPDVPSPPTLEPEQARFRLFDSITTFFKNAAARQPLVLIVDDLHWADKPTLLLLQFLARELRQSRLLVVATYRDVELRRHHPLSQTLGELAREQLSQRILLRGITAPDVSRFIEMTAGRTPPESLVAAVYRETEGNPFFVSEIVRLLVADGRLEQWDAGGDRNVSIPQSVREVVGRRLDRLSDECNRILTVAAVIGRDFSLNVLEAVVGGQVASRDRLLEFLEEAVAARVIAETPRAIGRYGFSHALIRETLYEELSTTRRVRLHRQIGDELERVHADHLEQHLAELAYHFFEAAPGGDVARAIDYGTRAAERATSQLAYEEAVAHYDRALQALELLDTPAATQRCELLLRQGEAQRRAGDFARARSTFVHAADLARGLADAAQLARAALGFAEEGIQAGHVDPTAISLLEEALAAIGPVDGNWRALLLARLAAQLYWTPRRHEVAALSQQAVDIAQRLGDPAALVRALATRQAVLWHPQHVDELLTTATEIVRLATASGERALETVGHEGRLSAFLQLGDMVNADREIDAHTQLATELRLPTPLWLSTSWAAMRALLRGRFDDAEALAREAYAIGQRLRPEDAAQSFWTQLLIVRSEQGRLAEVEATVHDFTRQYPQLPAWRCALAYLWSEVGREADARAEFERLAAHDFADISQDFTWLVALTLLADVCFALGDAARAALLYEQLRPYAGRNVVVSFGTLFLGSASRFLGLLATTMQRWDEAEHHFDDALGMHVRMGAKPYVAHTQFDYARMLLAGAAPDRVAAHTRAVGLLNDALETAQALGMKTLVERITARKLAAQGGDLTDVRTSIDAVASTVQRERPDLRRCMAADGTVTLMFSDMEGFTQMTERLGDRAAHKVIQAHNAIVREQVAAHAGCELELQGDGFLLAFADARRALRCAVAIQRAFATYSDAHPEQPVRVRIGLHTGAAITEADRFFGKTVILAARIAAQARGGEILASSAVKGLADDGAPAIRFGNGRETTLKGLADTYMLYPVDWTTTTAA